MGHHLVAYNSSTAQVQLVTKRLKQRMFIVENGDVIDAPETTNPLVSDFIVPPNDEMLLEEVSSESRQLSPTGYV